MYEILKLNEISKVAGTVFNDNYSLVKESAKPDGIVLRSFNMHEYEIPESVLCVGRAGAGVNNIPLDKCAEKGIVVFNTPGANANAVKELVMCGLFLAGRNVVDGINWASTLKGKGAEVGKLVEKGKSSFVGKEIMGKTLGVIGLGAIGVLVANAANALGMNVLGYDPYISVDGAWHLDNKVVKETDVTEIFKKSDFVTLHVPLNDSTRGIVNADTLALMKDGSAVLNFARGELVDSKAMLEAVASGKISRYVTDFPSDEMLNVENVVAIPHLGASTPEAEDNCAVMVARQMRDFFENGNIVNSVNFPACKIPRKGCFRITVIHKNVKNVLNAVTGIVSGKAVNIANMLSQAKGDYAYLILDLDEKLDDATVEEIKALDAVIRVRTFA